MNGINSRNELLFESGEQLSKENKKYSIIGKFFGIFGTLFSLYMIHNFLNEPLTVMALLLFLMVAIFYFILSFGTDNLKVYESGITLPLRSSKNIIKNQEEFISFGKIEKIYMTSYQSHDLFVIKFKDSKKIDIIEKKHIEMTKFWNALEGRVPIEKEKSWDLKRNKEVKTTNPSMTLMQGLSYLIKKKKET